MKSDFPNQSNRLTLFDELAEHQPAAVESLTLDEVRETAGWLDRLVDAGTESSACRRVRARLFARPASSAHNRSVVPIRITPGWLRVAAAVALLITGLAVLDVLPGDASSIVAEANAFDSMLLFPGEAVLDSQLARLDAELNAMSEESFWNSESYWSE